MEREGKRRDVEKERYCLPACPEATARVGPRPGAGDPDVFVHVAVRHVPPSVGFDELSMMTEHIIRCNPSLGHVFVFCNDASSVVMEADLPDILRGHYRSGTHPNALLGSFST
ncbi:MAG: hypothetical protein Q8Q12_04430 [bacterium]|nr:hypothetical protein [bacterium]